MVRIVVLDAVFGMVRRDAQQQCRPVEIQFVCTLVRGGCPHVCPTVVWCRNC